MRSRAGPRFGSCAQSSAARCITDSISAIGAEVGFYGSASAELRTSARDTVHRLAAVLQARSEALRVEGHTDNIPIHNRIFASNWELSSARLSKLVRQFADQYRFDPQRLSATGYAEYPPVAPNESAEGRAKNRRADIVILDPTPPEVQSPEAQAASWTTGAGSSALQRSLFRFWRCGDLYSLRHHFVQEFVCVWQQFQRVKIVLGRG